jgi:hypothetical protein
MPWTPQAWDANSRRNTPGEISTRFLDRPETTFSLRSLRWDDNGAGFGITDARILALAIFAPSVASPVKAGCGELKDRFFVHRISRQFSTQPAFSHHDDPVTQRQ